MKNKLKKVIQPPEFLGILGGGQLGRFFTIAAQEMGYSVLVLDPDDKSPAGNIADKHICKSYDDLAALDELKTNCLAVSTEFENIPAETLKYLEKNIIVRPSSKAVSIVQNRINEKKFIRDCGCPVGQYKVIDNLEYQLLPPQIDIGWDFLIAKTGKRIQVKRFTPQGKRYNPNTLDLRRKRRKR